MPKYAKWLSVAAVLLILLMGSVYLTAQLSASLVSATVEPATKRAEEFDRLYRAVSRGDLESNQYKSAIVNDPARYSFITYKVSLSSFCPIPAEWALVNLSPNAADVALLQGDPETVPPLGGRTLTATLLTENEAVASPRNVWAEYYILGSLKSVTAAQAAVS